MRCEFLTTKTVADEVFWWCKAKKGYAPGHRDCGIVTSTGKPYKHCNLVKIVED